MLQNRIPASPPIPGIKQLVPGRASFDARGSLSLAFGAPYFGGGTEGGRGGQAWHGRAAAGGRLALGRAGAPRGILKMT